MIAAHAVVAAFTPLLTRFLGSRAFFVLALPPLAGAVFLISQSSLILSGGSWQEVYDWIPALGISITFNMGLIQWILGLIVTIIGFLILVYCRWYFADKMPNLSGAILLAFAGAMLGLVTADDLVVLFIFWELTTIFSYLLIGHDPTRRANRGAATTALVVTTSGGLMMLLGIIAVGNQSGTFSLAAITENPPTTFLAGFGALLMLIGALSKSALVPFHFWLPGAMAAPTPISAYLHAAAMVKAGIYLVAVLAPVFASVPYWRPAVLILGATTMVVGGWRALRQTDLKLLLAYGTVSQLGFITLLVGMGTKAGAMAGIGMMISHALFKSTLFMIVGIVDHSAGTRDLRQLTGVGYRAPWLAVIGGLSALSMAGIPPLIGFITKEAAFESIVYLITGEQHGVTPLAGMLLAVALVFGSAITVAYSLRWWWGAFANKDDAPVLRWNAPAWGMVAVPTLITVGSAVGGFLGGPLTDVIYPYAEMLTFGTRSSGFGLWHGFTAPLAMSAIAVIAGVLLFYFREPIARVQATFPAIRSAEDTFHRSMRGLDRLAVETTARTQRGSLPVYVGTILVTFVVLTMYAMLDIRFWPDVTWFDSPIQVAVGAVMATAALVAAKSRGRVRGVLLTSVTGYGLAVTFLTWGAPDLALTQILVESVTLVVFVLVIRKLPRYFTNRPLSSSRWWRVLVAIGVGASATLISLLAAGARIHEPISEAWYEAAYEFGAGLNIVNVALVDTRAWDTFGEISVLVIAATGVASLIFLQSRQGGVTRTDEALAARNQQRELDTSPAVWLRAGQTMSPLARSLMFEVVTRVLFWVLIIASLFLLLSGHNRPGGGFAGGLVAGMALMVRYLAAGRHELDEAAPFDAGRLLGSGLVISVTTAIAPVFFGGTIFQSYDYFLNIPGPDSVTLFGYTFPLFGELHLVTSTAFDIGVYLVVIGTILDFARSLGSGIDVQALEDNVPTPLNNSAKALPGGKRR
ncbi:MAG: Na+/H+ antiporter subunit A [Propionibacterium sp.]|nr:Na+/H+ antiporter subunit A [Propionibacterium sp.]